MNQWSDNLMGELLLAPRGCARFVSMSYQKNILLIADEGYESHIRTGIACIPVLCEVVTGKRLTDYRL